MTDKTIFPGGLLYLQELLSRFGKAVGVTVNPSDNREITADKIWKTLYAMLLLWG